MYLHFVLKVNTLMGRPPGRIHDRPLQMRVSDDFVKGIDRWRSRQSDKPSRSEAIRRLVEQALKHERSWQAGPHKGASQARAMAAQELDRLGDRSATDEERRTRKHRILKGPPEFRDMRADQPKRNKRPARSNPVSKLNASNDV